MAGNEREGGLLDNCKGVKMKYLSYLSVVIPYVLLRQINDMFRITQLQEQLLFYFIHYMLRPIF